MSWMKRPQAGEGSGAGPQPYPAPQAQPFTNQQSMYPGYQGGAANVSQPGQYWPPTSSAPPQQQYNQQYGTVYQQEYAPNANQVYQQPQYNQNYSNSGYTNPQQSYQQNYYQNQPQQNYPPNQAGNSDGWEDNWDWGWDESAKQAQRAQKAQSAGQQQPHHQEHAFNNANVLEESFAPTNTWNWAMDDKKANNEPASLPPEQQTSAPASLPPTSIENNMSPEPNNVQTNIVNNGAPLPAEEVRTLSDRDIVKEHMPNLALGKRFHLDNLTPQWSIESQMSQESSDGPQTHSESTYRSENQSRNSNSPGLNTDNSNFNYSQSRLDDGYTQNSEWSRQSDEPTLAESTGAGSRRESHEELVHTMQEMNLANHENISSENIPTIERRNSQQSSLGAHHSPAPAALPPPTALPPPPAGAQFPSPAAMPPPPPVTTAPAPPPPAASPVRSPSAGAPLPPPTAAQLGPAVPPSSNAVQPALSAVSSLPPPNFPPPTNSQNPFKHSGSFAHKPKSSSSGAGGATFPPAVGSHLSSPAPGGKPPAGRAPPPVGFEANLETTPDNSERPDAPTAAWAAPPAPHVPDNMEVAPQNDRNEYLQTAHLSADYAENAEFAREGAPPPGPRRMGVGRHEPAAERDEPPPGLARMVPGRQTNGDGADYQRAYRRGDGGRTPEYRPPARATPAGESSAAAEYAQYARPAHNLQEPGAAPEPPEPAPEPARRSSADTDRERAYDEPRRDERDRDGDGRYSRPERKSTREERRPERRDRRDRDRERERERERDESPDTRRKRRSARSHRYETEDTDYYSDKERERRRHREGSYSSRPPRDERRYEERGARARRAGGERHERSYRDIDPSRKHGNRRRERDEDRRRVTFSRAASARASSRSEGETYSSPSRADSREAGATDEEPERRRERRARHSERSRTHDLYYEGYGGGASFDPYQRAQYSYYERLRATDPAAYMQLYKRLMAAHDPRLHDPRLHDPRLHDPRLLDPRLHDPLDGYAGATGVYGARDERGSVHSGRSSAAGLKGHDTYYAFRHDSLRDATSLRTDLSDRDLTTDMSLPTNLDASTVRSDRMTPHRYSTAHVKGSISSRHVVVVRGAWPVDGLPARVQLVSLAHALRHEPAAAELAGCPGPLLRGVTHKKSVAEYCLARARAAPREAARDAGGYTLLWELLALLLRQNGVVVGSDIAELLMKNTREHEYKAASKPARDESRRGSSASGSAEEERSSPDCAEHAADSAGPEPVDERAALDKYREYLLYGNRQEALEWAMSCNLWAHALALAEHSPRRVRSAVAARFLAATPRRDPLHTLYAALAAATPPAATCASEERWGDWRPHAAMLLANAGARPDLDTRTLTTLGDSLASRGLPYSAQFCYLVGGVEFAAHPLAPLSPAPAPEQPPRLALLLAEPRARSLAELAPARAVLATEIYEYARSLSQEYVLPTLQPYKLVQATRLIDCGLYERALGYVEQASRAVSAAPGLYSPRLARALAELAHRLQPEPLDDAAPADDGEPRDVQWLRDVTHVAQLMQSQTESVSAAPAPPAAAAPPAPPSPQPAPLDYYQHQHQHQLQQPQYSWDQPQQYPAAEAAEAAGELPAPYQPAPEPYQPAPEPAAEPAPYYEDWSRTEEHHAASYAEPYWQPSDNYYTGEQQEGAGGAEDARPTITMPGTRAPAASYQHDDDHADAQTSGEADNDTPKSSRKADGKNKDLGGKGEGGKGGGWLGGILTKLSLRPPNQMILPDDKNPTIVWDAEKKRWKNLDGEDAAEGAPPPPPRAADLAALMPTTSTPNQSPAGPAGAGGPPVSNIFKMQKGRHIKKAYVDVLNPGGGGGAPRAPAPAPAAPAPPPAAPPTYFVPAPAQTVHVSIPPSPSTTPPPAPESDDETMGGVYEPLPAGGVHSGI